jgi:hypothetical protein
MARLARYLQKHHVTIPPLPTYPERFTTMNFVSLDYLAPLLVEHERRRIRELEAQLIQVHDAHARLLIQEAIDLKRRHIAALEAIEQSAPV